jgi:threonine/homoserine/homoserine lactone efflux protein
MDTLTAIAPFVVAGSILPTWTILVIALLGTARPVVNSTAFILGNAAFRMLLGLAVLFVVPLPDSESFRLDSGVWDARIVILLGLALMALAAWLWTRRPEQEGKNWVEKAENIRPRTAFLAGAAVTASPGVQYAYLLGGIAVVLETSSSGLGEVVALTIFVLALQWMLALPIAIYLLFPQQSARILRRMKVWLGAYGQRLVAAVLGVAGAYVTISGIMQLLG